MIIIGAGGYAKELIDILATKYGYTDKNLFLFDDVNLERNSLFGFTIIHTIKEVTQIFNEVSVDFCLGVGTPETRYLLNKKFERLGGKPKSIISPNALIGNFDVLVGNGSCIMANATISNGSHLGKGTLINTDVLVGHDVKIGDYCDISPGAKLTGHCKIGDYVSVATGACILPKVNVGKNSFIGAGSIVTTDIPENSVVVGVIQSRVVSKRPPFEE